MVNFDRKSSQEGKKEAQKQWEVDKADFIRKNSDHLRNYFLGLPDLYKKIWWRCFTAKSSKPGAIKAKCLDCSAYQKLEVANCRVFTCPLHKYRPYQNLAKN